MDTSTTLEKARYMVRAIGRKLKACSLGVAVATAMSVPTTAFGAWDFANTPLFWASGVNPNVMLMVDDSGSMHHMLISQRYQEYRNDLIMEKADGTVLTTPLDADSGDDDYDEKWYFCQTYDNSLKKCTGTTVQVPTGTFAIQTPGIASVKTVTETVVKNTRNWNTYKGSCSSNCLNGGDEFFYKAAHGFVNGDKVTYNCGNRCPAGLNDGDEYFIINATADKFQLANSAGGSAIAFNRSRGDTTSGDYDVTSYTTATSTSTVKDMDYIYQSGFGTTIPNAYGVNELLCDTRKKPGDTDFIINNITITSNAQAYDLAQYAGVMLTKKDTGNLNDTCVRFRESISAKSPPAEGVAALNGHTPKDTPYTASSDAYSVVEGRWIMFLLNKHVRSNVGANPSVNFETFPAQDPNVYVNNADDFRVVPSSNRIEAARQSARRIVLDNYKKMQIGLASFVSCGSDCVTGEIDQSVGSPTDPVGNKTTMIGTSNGTDFPFNAWDTANSDGAVGKLRAQYSTPLAKTQKVINDYYKGTVASGITTAPTQYRCQKNYSVILTDGEATSDSGYLNDRAQEGYDTDLMTGTTNIGQGAGNDVTGKSWNDPKFPTQNIETFTIGLGLENNTLRSTPLVNAIDVPASSVNQSGFDNSLYLEHGLETGEAVNMVASTGTMCVGTDYSCMYYAVKVDATHLRLASSPALAEACEKTYNTTNCLTISNGAKKVSTGPGKALFAYTPDQLSASMSKVFAQILNLSASASAVSANSKQFGANSVVYQAGFNTEDWSGVLTAYNLSFDSNGKMQLTRKWSTAPKTDIVSSVAVTTPGTMDSPSKLASQKTPSAMFTWKDGAASGAGGVTLDAAGTGLASLPAWQQTGIGGTNGMKWLRGDALPTTASGFRDHSPSGYLGDVINADPLFVGTLNNGYGLCGTCSNAASYEAYRASKAARTPVLFTGANDGMMHVINADNGAELMSFIPAGVYATTAQPNKLFLTTQDTYVGDNHRYFVDGASTAGDAELSSGSWGTYVVGALGQGGKSVYAINASDTSYTDSDIMWEFKHSEMGYTYGKPIIGRLKDNKWYAIVANGLDSTSARAKVFVIRLDNMATYEVLETPDTSADNGMMVIQAERDTNFYITKLYGGDMRGNIWRFDLSTSGSFPDGTKLFQATSPSAPTQQSITGGIRLGKHPNNLGTMVYFGTGKYFEVKDGSYIASGAGQSTPNQDTFYAVLDKSDGAVVTRTDLVQQTFNASSGNIRTSSVNTVDYTGSGGKKGWFIELLDGGSKKGERVVTTPVLSGGRIIFVSMVPEVGDKCIATGYSWLNELDALGGGQLPDRVLDTNNDGKIDASDSLTASLKMDGFLSEPTIIKGTGIDTKVMGSTSTAASIQGVRETQGASGTAGGSGRLSWQQLQ